MISSFFIDKIKTSKFFNNIKNKNSFICNIKSFVCSYFKTIKNYNNDKKRVKELIDFVKKSGGLEYAIGIMKDFQQKAKDILNDFPDSQAKISLNLMLDYVIERKL